METMPPYVSVIIPVFNDQVRLRLCLAALARQTYPHDRFEVIVVDNGSDEPLEPFETGIDNIRLECESRAGSYSARNRGISCSTGEIIAFTDSDCLPAPDWIETGVRHVSVDGVGLVAGRINLFYRDPARPTSVEIYETYHDFQQKEYVERHRFGATGNVFTRRQVIETVGPFDDRLMSGGDAEWGQRVAARGFTLRYAEDVVVAHPTRGSFAQISMKTRRIAGGAFDQDRCRPHALVKTVRHIGANIVELPVIPVQALFDSRIERLDYRLRVAYVRGTLQFVLILERIRLLLGARSVRI